MPRFFFHFHDGESRCADTIGLELADSERAYLEAVAAAREMWPELLAKRTDPTACVFFITDEDGAELFQVRFAELIDSCRHAATHVTRHPLMGELTHSARRARAATDELQREVGVARKQLTEASDLLRRLDVLGGGKRAAA